MTNRVLQVNLEALIGVFNKDGKLVSVEGSKATVYEADFKKTLETLTSDLLNKREIDACQGVSTVPNARR